MWNALLSLLPLLVRVAGLILDKNGADEKEKQAVLDMIVKSKDDPLVAVQMKDDFKNLRAKLKERLKTEGPPA
jgi:hypothetical protein